MKTSSNVIHHEPWNKGKIVGQKAPFKVKDIWTLRVRLQMEGRVRELALFNLGIDSKLRGCDLVSLKVRDMSHGEQVATLSWSRPLGSWASRSMLSKFPSKLKSEGHR